jgi:uncharacterized protein with GYD domain
MATFIALISLTQHGEEDIQHSVDRAEAFRKLAKQRGASVKDVYWTMGAYDGVLIFEAPDDETATALMLSLASKGCVRTHTLRAFNRDQMRGILGNIG